MGGEDMMAVGRGYVIVGGEVWCYRGGNGCHVLVQRSSGDVKGESSRQGLAEGEVTPFHDSDLVDATKKINAIIKELGTKKMDHELSLLETPDGLLLAWGRQGAISQNDEPAKLKRALKIK